MVDFHLVPKLWNKCRCCFFSWVSVLPSLTHILAAIKLQTAHHSIPVVPVLCSPVSFNFLPGDFVCAVSSACGGRMASSQPRQVIALPHWGERQLLLRNCLSCSLPVLVSPRVPGSSLVLWSALNTIWLSVPDTERKWYREPLSGKRELPSKTSIKHFPCDPFIRSSWTVKMKYDCGGYPLYTNLGCSLWMPHFLIVMLHRGRCSEDDIAL